MFTATAAVADATTLPAAALALASTTLALSAAAVADATTLPATALALASTTLALPAAAIALSAAQLPARGACRHATGAAAASIAATSTAEGTALTSALTATFIATRAAEPIAVTTWGILLPVASHVRRALRRLLPHRRRRGPGLLQLATPATGGAAARGPNATLGPNAAALAAAAAAAARGAAAGAAVVECRSRAVCAQGRSGSGRARVDR